MTRPGAERICHLATAAFGSQVETRVETYANFGRRRYRVVLVHAVLKRRISIKNVDDWTNLKAAWSLALEILR